MKCFRRPSSRSNVRASCSTGALPCILKPDHDCISLEEIAVRLTMSGGLLCVAALHGAFQPASALDMDENVRLLARYYAMASLYARCAEAERILGKPGQYTVSAELGAITFLVREAEPKMLEGLPPDERDAAVRRARDASAAMTAEWEKASSADAPICARREIEIRETIRSIARRR